VLLRPAKADAATALANSFFLKIVVLFMMLFPQTLLLS
jgi:hypothetical protein